MLINCSYGNLHGWVAKEQKIGVRLSIINNNYGIIILVHNKLFLVITVRQVVPMNNIIDGKSSVPGSIPE